MVVANTSFVVVLAYITTKEVFAVATIVRRQPKGCPEPVYYYHETYRVKVSSSQKGKRPGSGKSKVKSRDIYLGTASQVLRKLQQGQRPQEVEKKEFGLVCAALRVAEEIGLVEVIDANVPKRRQGLTVGQYILIGVLNKITSPTSRNGIKDWIKRTVLPERLGIDPDLLTSQNFWDHFDLIMSEKELKHNKERLANGEIPESELFNDDVIYRIEEGIWQRVLDTYQVPLDCVLYDTTNFFSFMAPTTGSFLARTGHNKHGRHNLRQVGLGMAVTKEAALPVLHFLYHGRCHDAKLFPEAMTDLVERYLSLTRGTTKLTVIFDKGNNSEDNIKKAGELKLRIIGSLVPSHHRDLTGVRLSRYSDSVDGYPAYTTTKDVFGVPVKIAVIYNDGTYRRQKRRLRSKIEELRTQVKDCFKANKARSKPEIEEALRDLARGSEYARYLDIQVEGRRYKKLSCRINLKNYREKLRTLGKTIIFTNDLNLPTSELVRLYIGKYLIEEQFKQLNNPDAIAFRPMYHWTDTKIKVYALMCVLALLVLQLMNYRARRCGLRMSNEVLRNELADIVEVVLVYSLAQVQKQLSSMSTIQRQLFEIFELNRYAPG